jgi:hypothetical protein
MFFLLIIFSLPTLGISCGAQRRPLHAVVGRLFRRYV